MDILEHQEEKKRPVFLKVLCILSWIWIGFSLLGNGIAWLQGKMSQDQIREQIVQLKKSSSEMRKEGWDFLADSFNNSIPILEQTNENFYLVNSIKLLMLVIGLIGVIWMWKGKKLGFHLYIVYCLIALGAVYLYASPSNILAISQIFEAIISGLFIFMYSRNLGWMKK